MPSIARLTLGETPEFSLAVAACAWPQSEDQGNRIRECLDRHVEWPLFLRVVERHRIAGLVHHVLAQIEGDHLPVNVMAALKVRADALARQSLRAAGESSRLVTILKDAGIPSIVLKGAPLAMLAYQNLGLRHSKDNDLLVSASDFKAAEAIMLSVGYERVIDEGVVSKKHIELYQQYHHEFEYVHTETGLRADLHHRLHINSAFGARIDPRNTCQTQSVDLGGGLQVSTLANSELLAYLCAHGSRHSWFRLKWLADVGALLAKNPEAASRLLEVSRSQGTSRSAMQALLLCNRFWGTPLPEQMPVAGRVVRKLVDVASSAMTAGKAATETHDPRFGTTRTNMHQYLLSSRPAYLWRQMLIDCLTPSDVDRLPEKVQFLYPLLRFPLWLVRKLAIQKPAQTVSNQIGSKEVNGAYVYMISGLAVFSEVKLTSAIAIDGELHSRDVVIRAGSVPAYLESPSRSGESWEAANGVFLLRLNGIGRFLIRDGREVIFDLDSACDTRTIGLYLLGTCFAILLQQRGNIVLHASAIAANDRAMLFCGSSGAGKSTMAALLCRRGYPLLNDDVCNLVSTPNDSYEVRPDGRMLKLWRESLDQLEWNRQPGMEVRADVEKYFSAPPVSEVAARPVGAIYILQEAPQGEENSIRRLRALDAMIELKKNAYRSFLVTAMDMEESYFHASAALQRGAGVYLLSRRKDFSDSDSLLQLLENHWASLSGQPSPDKMELSHGPDDERHYLAQ